MCVMELPLAIHPKAHTATRSEITEWAALGSPVFVRLSLPLPANYHISRLLFPKADHFSLAPVVSSGRLARY